MHLYTPLSELNREGNEEGRGNARTFSRAMLLKGSPKSPEAIALVDWMVEEVIIPHRRTKGQCRPTMIDKYRAITRAFLADLFRAASEGRWSKLSTDNGHLAAVPGGRSAFGTMREALGASGYLEELRGYFMWEEHFGVREKVTHRTSFRPTLKLLSDAEGRGVGLEDFSRHFVRSEIVVSSPQDCLRLVATKPKEGLPGKRLPFPDDDPKADAIVAQMVRLNAFLLEEGRIEGIAFAGLRRSFNDADKPDFSYQWHGRYYSMPEADHYERLKGGCETRQRIIVIDGKAAREVDVSASQLTILHGLLGVPFDAESDPYKLPGVPREAVKSWLVVHVGAQGEKSGGNRLKKAKAAGLERYPFLHELAALGIGPLDLQYHEAEIISLAMGDLMSQGIGFLPVHDALLVAEGNEELAAEAFRSAYLRYFRDRLGKETAPVPILKWGD